MFCKSYVRMLAVLCLSTATKAEQVVSYYVAQIQPSTKVVVVPSLPQGFVLTDIHTPGNIYLDIYERQNAVDVHKGRIRIDQQAIASVNMVSGIPFAPQSSLVLESTNTVDILISGYIPALPGNAPAVSTYGLVILAMLIIIAGTISLLRKGDATKPT